MQAVQTKSKEIKLTKRMTRTKLRLLLIFTLELIPNAVQQLDVTLLGILFQSGDESPRHCARRLPCYRRVLPVKESATTVVTEKKGPKVET